MWISPPRKPSGREQKRLLNRAHACGLCAMSLGIDRALFATQSGTERGLLVAHPACVAEQAERDAERSRALSERLLAAGRAYAAEVSARSRLIVVEAAPPRVRPASPWQVQERRTVA